MVTVGPSANAVLEPLGVLLPGHESRALRDSESPYAGLAAFQETDANRFFGRSRDISTMLARLPDQPLIGVVGPSGVEKSSAFFDEVVENLPRGRVYLANQRFKTV